MKRFRPGWVYDTTDQEPERADTIRELAVKLGCNPDELEKTVAEFNEACDKETPFDLMKLDGKRTRGLSPEKTNWANPIVNAPFYGCVPGASPRSQWMLTMYKATHLRPT